MASIPERLSGHVTLEVECLDRLYLNGYIGALATPGGLVNFMLEQLGKPIPSPVVLGQVTTKFRENPLPLRAEDRTAGYEWRRSSTVRCEAGSSLKKSSATIWIWVVQIVCS